MVISGEKKLVPRKELKTIEVGNYEEVSVKRLWPEYCDRAEVKDYFPPKMMKGRMLQKEYFFNILNTFVGPELQAILAHAHQQRNSIEEQMQKQEAIILSEQMAEDLFKYPFVSVSTFVRLF